MTILEKILAITKDIGATEQTIRQLKRQLNDAQLKLADLRSKSDVMQTSYKQPKTINLPTHDPPKPKPVPTPYRSLPLPTYHTQSGSRARRIRANSTQSEICYISSHYIRIAKDLHVGTHSTFNCRKQQRQRPCVWLTTDEATTVHSLHVEHIAARRLNNAQQ